MTTTKPRGALIELIEHAKSPGHARDLEAVGIIRPSEIRVNGTALLCPKDDPVEVHEIRLGATRPDDALLRVTITCWARRIVMEARDTSQEADVDTLRTTLIGWRERDDNPTSAYDALIVALDHLGQSGLDAVAAELGLEPTA